MKYLLFVFIATLNLLALDFKVASYNVENFFDLHYDKTEYKEYIPHSKSWNTLSYNNKLINITKVIQNLNVEIIALQEIESQRALDAIVKKNPSYQYSQFLKNKNSAIGVALLSKFPIVSMQNIMIDKYDKFSRDILKVTVNIQNKKLLIYINHWRSKRAAESQRIKYALALQKDVEKLNDTIDYIILGDLNSNYNEYQTFKYDKRLNDSFNITGINQILNTTINENFVHKKTLFSFNKKVHFNTWLELKKEKRFSSIFKKQHNTPDNIILSKSLFDTQGISYIENSFRVFTPNYLYKNKRIQRWNRVKKTGFSDHLPIYASFSTRKQNYNFNTNSTTSSKTLKRNTISGLYEKENITNYTLKNIIVIYKSKDISIIRQVDDQKAIMIYKPSPKLQLGYIYDLQVDKIDTYFGLKEITQLSSIVKKEKYTQPYTNLYLDGNTINLEDYQYSNHIIYNLKGVYSRNYLYFDNKKIRLYFKNGIKKPEEKSKITLSSGHLSIYKSSIQIVVHKTDDFIKD